MKNVPNTISLGRLFLSPGVLLLSAKDEERLAAVLFLVLALSDALDGFLARVMKAQTTLGKFLDPLADKVLLLCGLVAVGSQITPLLFFILVARDTTLVIGSLILRRFGFVPRPSLLGKGATLTVSATVIVAFLPSLGVNFPEGVLRALESVSISIILVSWIDYSLKGVKLIMERR